MRGGGLPRTTTSFYSGKLCAHFYKIRDVSGSGRNPPSAASTFHLRIDDVTYLNLNLQRIFFKMMYMSRLRHRFSNERWKGSLNYLSPLFCKTVYKLFWLARRTQRFSTNNVSKIFIIYLCLLQLC